MRTRLVGPSVALAMVVTALVASAPAQAACVKPSAPILKAVWGTAGGPRITLAPGKGVLPRSVSWTVAHRSAASWSAWSKWTQRTVRTRTSAVVHIPKLDAARTRVAYNAFAQNACGRSKSASLEVPLATAEQLATTRPLIPHTLPQSLGGVAVVDLMANPFALPVAVTANTPGVCAMNASRDRLLLQGAGTCRFSVSQRTSMVTTPNPDVSVAFEVLPPAIPLAASTKDRPDDLSGFQIHVVYVNLSDAPGHDQHASGLIDTWVELSQRWLADAVGRRLLFDTAQGKLDVTFLQSRHTMADLSPTADEGSGTHGLELLRTEYLAAQGRASAEGKNLLFMVDAPISADYCGWADTPGDLALVTTTGDGCWNGAADFTGQGRGLNWVSVTIIHELLHNMGVGHTCGDDTDMMLGGSCRIERAKAPVTLDAGRAWYVGADEAGADILQVKVWSDGSGTRHLPQPGTCYVGEACSLPRTYWSGGTQVLELQRLVGGTWQAVASFTSKRLPEGGAYPFTYDVTWTPAGTGSATLRYRLQPTAEWMEYLGEPFSVVVPY